MGDFRIVVDATGGHGCQREKGTGEGAIFGCRSQTCPDCITQEYVAKMKAAGHHVSKAVLIHWPNAAQWGGKPVVDEFHGPSMQVKPYTNSDGTTGHWIDHTLIHRIRHGFFPGHPKEKEWLAEKE